MTRALAIQHAEHYSGGNEPAQSSCKQSCYNKTLIMGANKLLDLASPTVVPDIDTGVLDMAKGLAQTCTVAQLCNPAF